MIHVLIVEDSPSMRLLLQHILEADANIRVVRSVASGEEALAYLATPERPVVDVVTMDIVMPGMDGFSATRRIMETTPLPIVIVSAAYKPDEAETSFKAIEAGAVALVEKPVGPDHPDYEVISGHMKETVTLMAGVKVVTRFPRVSPRPRQAQAIPWTTAASVRNYDLLAIGASTGGPPAIMTILTHLTPQFPLPILIVQHISQGFVSGFARWLANGAHLPVHVAVAGEVCLPGHVYLAPDHVHMGITHGLRILLDTSEPEKGQRPSVAFLFRAVRRMLGSRVIGVLLTGMGSDGAAELKELRDAGALTFAQDESSSVVYGMPGEAAKLKAADYVLEPLQIAEKIHSIIK